MSQSRGHPHPQLRKAERKATVDIHDAVAGLLSVLEIDAPANNDVACTVESTLFDLRIQVVRVRSHRMRRRAVHEYEVVEFDGGPLRAGRQHEVRTALLARLRAS